MAKRKLTFEGVVATGSSAEFGYKFMFDDLGFRWANSHAVETTHPNWDHIQPGSGTAALYPIGGSSPTAIMYMPDGSEFSVRKFKLLDINDDDFGFNIAVFGYRDGVEVAFDQPFVLGTTTTMKLSKAFKNVDSVRFYSNGQSVAYDDIIVKVPDEPPLV